MTLPYHSSTTAVMDPGPIEMPTDLPYKPPVPGLPSTPPTAPIEEPPLPPDDTPPILDPPSIEPMPSPVTI